MVKKTFLKIYPIISVLFAIIIWWIAAEIVDIEFMLPTPYKTMQDLIVVFSDINFYKSALHTLGNVLLSFTLSFLCAFLLAILSANFETIEKLFYPVVLIIKVLPTMSVVFLSILWLTSENRPILIVFLVIFPMLYVTILSSIKSIDKNLKDMVKIYGIPKKDVIFGFYVPSVIKSSFSECVAALSFSVKLSISGEALTASKMTIGFLMKSANATLETGLLIAYTVIAVIMGFLVEFICKLLAKIVLKLRCRYAKA